MENLVNKEQRLKTALEKLMDLSNSFSTGQNDISSLNVEKNQLQSEKNEIERKYNQLLTEYDNIKKKLDLIQKESAFFDGTDSAEGFEIINGTMQINIDKAGDLVIETT